MRKRNQQAQINKCGDHTQREFRNIITDKWLYIQLPGTRFYSLQQIFKNHYHNTFLVYFNSISKRNRAKFYSLDYITKLYKISKSCTKLYGLLHSTLIIIKNIYIFFSPSMSRKSIKFGDEKVNKRSFYKINKPLGTNGPPDKK